MNRERMNTTNSVCKQLHVRWQWGWGACRNELMRSLVCWRLIINNTKWILSRRLRLLPKTCWLSFCPLGFLFARFLHFYVLCDIFFVRGAWCTDACQRPRVTRPARLTAPPTGSWSKRSWPYLLCTLFMWRVTEALVWFSAVPLLLIGSTHHSPEYTFQTYNEARSLDYSLKLCLFESIKLGSAPLLYLYHKEHPPIGLQ